MQKYEFRKIPFPESKKDQADLAIKLAKFGVTLKSYASSLEKNEIIRYDNYVSLIICGEGDHMHAVRNSLLLRQPAHGCRFLYFNLNGG